MTKSKAQQERFLILTSAEATWKFDRPVIFLGEWCCLYSRRRIWGKLDGIMGKPFAVERLEKERVWSEARELEDKLFSKLYPILNEYHGTNFDRRYWSIVLGHWFRRFINVVYNRVGTLKECFNNNPIIGVAVYSDEKYHLSCESSLEAIFSFNDPKWNSVLYGKILEIGGEGRAQHYQIEKIRHDDFMYMSSKGVKAERVTVKSVLLTLAQRLLSKFSVFKRENDGLIINTYLSKKQELLLSLRLGQFPYFRNTLGCPRTGQADISVRATLAEKMMRGRKSEEDSEILLILQALVFDLMPRCYIEAYNKVGKLAEEMRWPGSPKFIFTSNCFDTDEVFKFWAADKISKGSKYVVGQHGNYGVTKFDLNPSIEEVTSDKFLTWGWEGALPQHTQAFILKTAGRQPIGYNPVGNLLLIELCEPHNYNVWDSVYEFGVYFEEQKALVSLLGSSVKNGMTIRLHAGHRRTRWCEYNRWKDFDTSLVVDDGSADIKTLLSECRLVIHSYDSTGILETLSQNVPTMAFWQNGFEHLRDSAVDYYKILHEAGIVHLSPESLADKINEVWQDVEGWWASESVQSAREIFCERYCRTSETPSKDLVNMLSQAK